MKRKVFYSLFLSLLNILLWSEAKAEDSNSFNISKELKSIPMLVIPILCCLIVAAAKTLIRLKYDKKYISIPPDRQKVVFSNSKKQIYISTALLLILVGVWSFTSFFNNDLSLFKFLLPGFIIVGIIYESDKLNKELAKVSAGYKVKLENEEKIETATEAGTEVIEGISELLHKH